VKNKPCFIPAVLRLRRNANLFVCGVAYQIDGAVADFEARMGAKGNILCHVPVALLAIVVKVLRPMRTRVLCGHVASRLTRPKISDRASYK
jgi:hypothetical protein